MKDNRYNFFNKKQKDDIFDRHIGSGELIFKQGENTITQIPVFIKNGKLLYQASGKEVVLNTYEEGS